MGARKNKMRAEIEAALRATGLPWRIEKGQEHFKVFLRNRMIAVFSVSGSNHDIGRDRQNILANIRRSART